MKHMFLVLSLFFSLQAYAGILGNSLFFEPYIAYKVENTKLTDLLNNTSEIKTTAPSLGIKIGFRSMAGVDLNLYGEITQGKAEITNFNEPNNFSKKTAGAELGVNSLGIIKMYLGTSISNDFTIEKSDQTQAFTVSGPSFHTGLLFKAIPFVNLGLQYNLNQYNTIKGDAYIADEKLETYYSKVDTQDYSVYISSTF